MKLCRKQITRMGGDAYVDGFAVKAVGKIEYPGNFD
jgi:hypothetical protein